MKNIKSFLEFLEPLMKLQSKSIFSESVFRILALILISALSIYEIILGITQFYLFLSVLFTPNEIITHNFAKLSLILLLFQVISFSIRRYLTKKIK